MKTKKTKKQRIQDILVVFMASGIIIKNIALIGGLYILFTNYQLLLEIGNYIPKETTGAILLIGLLALLSQGMVIGKQV